MVPPRAQFSIRGLMLLVAGTAVGLTVLREWTWLLLLFVPLGFLFAPVWVPIALVRLPRRAAMAAALGLNTVTVILGVAVIDPDDFWGGAFGPVGFIVGWFGFATMIGLQVNGARLAKVAATAEEAKLIRYLD